MLGRLACVFAAATLSTAAYAQPITQPIWASTPNAEWDASARAQFIAAIAKRGLPPAETVAIPAPAAPPTAALLAQGTAALRASAFDKAVALLGDAAKQALATGGAGLEPGQAPSLFFHQAVAIQLASGASYSEPFTDITPPEAKTAYLRAAVLGGGAMVDDEATTPLVEASWRLAKVLAAARPRTKLTVAAHPRARVSLDGRPGVPSPAVLDGLAAGEHLLVVEEPGHAPWSIMLALGGSENHVDVPATPLLVYDPAAAASQARSKGAAFSLLGQLHLGRNVEIDLRLVDAKTGETRASTAAPLAETTDSPDLASAVLRLDELADQTDLARRTAGADGRPAIPLSLAPPPARAPEGGPQLGSDTKGWLRLHWPVAAAVGSAIGTALALGIVVAKDK